MNVKIAYQGRPGAYSHLACLKAFPELLQLLVKHLKMRLKKLTLKETDISFIPVENSLSR